MPSLARPSGCVLAATALAAGGLAALCMVVGHEPPFVAAAADGERAAGRMITKAAALRAALGQPGSWEAAVVADELNAWLAIDLPRNHPGLLPRGIVEPRLRFRPHRVDLAVRLGRGWPSAVASAELRIRLRGVNQLEIIAENARLGAIPIPPAAVLGRLAGWLRTLGMPGEVRPQGGRMALVVYIPAGRDEDPLARRLESLRLDDGELFLAGTTHETQVDAGAGGSGE